MDADEALLKKRFRELAERAESRGVTLCSDFLNLYEQSVLAAAVPRGVSTDGGFDGAERRVAVFSPDGAPAGDSPIAVLQVSPLNRKFADDLSHRDFLGALLATGVKRETLGDILVTEEGAFVLCLTRVRDFLCNNLTAVKHTAVHCEVLPALPDAAQKPPQNRRVNVASARLDALIAAVWHLPRGKSAALCAGEKVFVNSRLTVSGAASLNDGDIVSVRGTGRFRLNGIAGESKKGRLFADVDIW